MEFRQSPLESVAITMDDLGFYKGKRVFLTGHTGFKGTWLSKILLLAGAEVMGYALEPATSPNIYSMADVDQHISSIIGDVRDLDLLSKSLTTFKPEIVIHLAAQPIVRLSYQDPIGTYATNVMGTAHVLEAIRHCLSVRSFVNVTTDKVYRNNEWEWGYRENEVLDGFDPYSNSKSCSELVTSTYERSFFKERDISISTARAGNVIGGGDFAPDRIIPDCIRAALINEPIQVRNPNSVRPYQHVLEPVCAYLAIAQRQYFDKNIGGRYNIGPDDLDCLTTGQLVDLFCVAWGEDLSWVTHMAAGPHEANYLRLDCSRARHILCWNPKWHVDQAIIKTVEWAKCYRAHDDISQCMQSQINDYIGI